MYIYLYTAEKKLLVHIWETHVETLADKEPGKSSFGGLRDQGRDMCTVVENAINTLRVTSPGLERDSGCSRVGCSICSFKKLE